MSDNICTETSNFINEHRVLCGATLGLSILGFLAWRAIIWLKECLCGTPKKTNDVATEIFQQQSDETPVPQTQTLDAVQPPVTVVTVTPPSVLTVTPSVRKDPFKELPTAIIISHIIGFLAPQEFAKLRATCSMGNKISPQLYLLPRQLRRPSKGAKTSRQFYLKQRTAYINRMFRFKSHPDFSRIWRETWTKAAASLTHLHFKDNEAVDAFPKDAPLFSKVNKFTIHRGFHHNSVGPLPRSVEALHVKVGHLEPYMYTSPSLKSLTLNRYVQVEYSNFQAPSSSIRTLQIGSYLHSEGAIKWLEQFSSLHSLKLLRGIGPQGLETLQKQLTALTSLRLTHKEQFEHIRYIRGGVDNTPQAINPFLAIKAFPTLRHAFLGQIPLTRYFATALTTLDHLDTLAVQIRFQSIDIPARTINDMEAIDTLGKIKNLSAVQLISHNSFLTGYCSLTPQQITEEHSTRLKHFFSVCGPKITWISLKGSELTDPRIIASTPRLTGCRQLDLSHAKCSATLLRQLLGFMPQLTYLKLTHSTISDPEPTDIYASSPTNAPAQPQPQFILQELRKFTFIRNTISETALQYIGCWQMPILEFLNLNHDPYTTDYQWDLKSAQWIHNNLRLLCSKKLVKHLKLGAAQIPSDDTLRTIAATQPALRTLDIAYQEHNLGRTECPVTEKGIHDLLDTLPHLETVNFNFKLPSSISIKRIKAKRHMVNVVTFYNS